MRSFLGGFFNHIVADKAWEQARKIILQQIANEAKKAEQKDGSECESDEIGATWCPQAGNASPRWHWCHSCSSGAILSESSTQAE